MTNEPGTESYLGDVTTGQIVGARTYGARFLTIFAAAGTYKVSVQFKVATGKVTVKERKLWAWVVAWRAASSSASPSSRLESLDLPLAVRGHDKKTADLRR